MALCVHVSAVRAGARDTHKERARRGIRRIPLCRTGLLEALLRAGAAYAEVLETSMDASASMALAAADVARGADTADLGDPALGAWMPACVSSIR